MDGVQVFIAADDGTLSGNKEEREEKLAERRQFEIDQYYHLIEKYTFKTSFVEISVEEARIWRDYNRGGQLDPHQEHMLNDLKKKIDDAIQQFTAEGGDAFFRLSTRSPKDAVDKLEKTVNILSGQLESAKKETVLDSNEQLVALRKAFFQAMSVKNADEAMQLVMYSSRAISDMKRALDNLDISSWNMKAIIREFVNIPIEGEFRGFVFNNSLNALSQYYADCFFKELPSRQSEIQTAVLDFFNNSIRHIIPFPSYIIDFVILPDYTVKIVELNPYSTTTGACLFDWEKDKNVLMNGPFEIRINHGPVRNVAGYLVPFASLFERVNTKAFITSPKQSENCFIM